MARLCILLAVILLGSSTLRAEDTTQATARALADHRAAMDRAARIDGEIRAERETLEAEIEALETERRELESAILELAKTLAMGEAKQSELAETNTEQLGKIQGIAGSIASGARDLEAFMKQSSLTALEPGRLERLGPFLVENPLWAPSDIAALGGLYMEEISFSSRVGVYQASYLDRAGAPRDGKVATFGKLTALYEHAGEAGFLLYAPKDQKLSAYSKRPSRGTEKRIRNYFSGREEAAPIDLTFGRDLRRAAREELLTVRTRHGGTVLLAVVIAGFAWLPARWFGKRVLRRTRGGGSEIAEVLPYISKWGAWAASPQRLAHRVALTSIFLLGFLAYLRGVTVLGQGEPEPMEVSLVNLVSLAPPPIAGRRIPRSMAPASRLAQYVPSKTASRGSTDKTEFEPELVTPSLDSPFAEGTPDVSVSLDLANLMSEDVGTGSEVVFESYELDQPPQAVVKIPPQYPHQARERGVEGAVQVKMLIQQDGTVGQVFIVDARPQGLFEESVKKCLPQWRFNPGKIDGKTVTAWVVTTIHFDLN